MRLVVHLKQMVGFAVFTMGAFLSSQVYAHGGLSMAEDMCKLTVGPYMMHFSGYQPESTQEKQFCEDIPATGQTIVVLDYIEQELRSLPAEVRIIKDTGTEDNLEAETVFHLPAKVYPNGSIDFRYTFDKPGKFVGLVSVGEKMEHVSRFPFSVGEPKFFSKFLNIYMVPVVAVVIVGAIVFFMRDRKPSQAASS
jgi:cytochrome c biogenesis factor